MTRPRSTVGTALCAVLAAAAVTACKPDQKKIDQQIATKVGEATSQIEQKLEQMVQDKVEARLNQVMGGAVDQKIAQQVGQKIEGSMLDQKVSTALDSNIAQRIDKLVDAKLGAGMSARLAKLEETVGTRGEALAFLDKVYQQQKAPAAAEVARERAPDAVFAVNIDGNQIDGPTSGAYVTIIEAWDFA